MSAILDVHFFFTRIISPFIKKNLKNILKLETFVDFLLQMHHFIQQVLQPQIVFVNFLLSLEKKSTLNK